MILKFIKKTITWIVGAFFASTILVVVAYRFIPVYITPLMVIRCCQQVKDGESLTMHHHWVALNEMSKYMPVAVIASEDQNFCNHNGFDFKAIKNAVEYNSRGGKKLGASTISQQTAKNVFLWPGRSWVRKGLEAYFTVLIELIWGKERIMEVYLNSIEMGKGIYGADACAECNFNGKTAAELSRGDCALIAATLPNPIKFSSKEPSVYMRKRRHQIEIQMQHIPLFKQTFSDNSLPSSHK